MTNERVTPAAGRRVNGGAIVSHGLLIAICLLLMTPLYWLVVTALRPTSELADFPPHLWPDHVAFHNFVDAFSQIPFLLYMKNSAFLALVNVFGSTLSATVVAYGFSKIQWAGRNAFFGILIVTMFLPGVVTMVPTYIIYHDLGWIGTYLPLTVPAFFAGAFNVFLLRQFYRTIPESLSESARIDGASEWRILWQIIVPLSTPAIMAVVIFTFIGNWDDFTGPLIYLQNQAMFTMPIGLFDFIENKGGTLWNQLMAASLMFMVPMLLVFFFGQQAFLKGGIRTSGLKS